ncbi:MAG: NAD-dependent epimerase/dehydratase family protein [Saprospiraceae bacterium]|nr:NAD-dependent epimerase/dehydratase family protein [Saprospiraceae bacterium]
MKRRTFLQKAGIGSLVLPTTISTLGACQSSRTPQVLILGGTYFVGPAVVQAIQETGAEITLFNRGKTNPNLFPQHHHIIGDRLDGIAAYAPLQEKEWDVVVDVWPEDSTLVDQATQSLQQSTKHYVFISSIAVYSNFQEVGLHEESAVVALPDSKGDWYYSAHKAFAEQLVRDRFPGRHTILRPGPIKGWRDPELDLLYWLVKLRGQAELLGPGTGNDPLQFVDVKDVGRFVAEAIDRKWIGTYNTTGPRIEPLLWSEFLQIAKQHLGVETKMYWPSEDFLREQQIRSFTDLPLWAPLSEDRGFMQISNDKLHSLSFELRPVQNTIADCLAWFAESHPDGIKFGASNSTGLASEKEQTLIQLWKAT